MRRLIAASLVALAAGTASGQTITGGSNGGSGGSNSGSMVYPGVGIPNSTGSAWGTSYGTSGSGSVALTTSPAFTTPNLGAATGTSLSVTGQLTSTVATGTPPLVVSSATNVPNLNASSLNGSVIGTSGATIPLLNTANTWGAGQTFSATTVFNSGVRIGSGSALAVGVGTLTILQYAAPTPCTVAGVSTCTVARSAGSAIVKYTLTTGTPTGSTVTLALPAATDGYLCDGVDITTPGRLQETTDSTTAPILTNYNVSGSATVFTAGDNLLIKCMSY